MQFDAALQGFTEITRYYEPYLDNLALLFVRIMGFIATAPVFNRKNLPAMLKIAIAIFLTGTLSWTVLSPDRAPMLGPDKNTFILFPVFTNMTVGVLIGFTVSLLVETVSTAGGLMNNQIGLSASSMMDPTSGRQVQVMETLLTNLGTIMFVQIGGIYWMLSALRRSLDVFPLYDVHTNIVKAYSFPHLVQMSSDVLTVGVQLIAPAMVVTIAMDVMLGIVNKTAQQMPVFQLSAALKPALGVGIVMVTMTTFLEALSQYFQSHSRIF